MKGRNYKKHTFLNVTFAAYLVLHNLILFQVNAINTVVKTMLEKKLQMKSEVSAMLASMLKTFFEHTGIC